MMRDRPFHRPFHHLFESLLDTSRQATLSRRLAAQLAKPGMHPEHGLLSITLDLGQTNTDWPGVDISQADSFYWAQAQQAGGDYRLALGKALAFNTSGLARFTALQTAFNGLMPVWQHDDPDHTGLAACACVGFAFADDEHHDASELLPNASLYVPSILLRRANGRCSATFSCTVRDGRNALDRWRNELSLLSTPPRHQPPKDRPETLIRKPAPLSDRAFLARARAALNEIDSGKLQKVVLTRRVRIATERAIALAPLLGELTRRHPECTIYGVGQSGTAFVGATPERLVALTDGIVRADALAGTAWLSSGTEQTDISSTASLQLQGGKNSHEQQLVVDAVRAALTPLCLSLDPPQTPEIMHLHKLQHLRTRITGRLRDGVDLFDVLAHLHPTPAVGGTPTASALRWLQAHGEQRGAWYTGGVGWIEQNGNGEIVVPLRCANIQGTQADLFAGAGIVAGSDPEQELAETEAKLGAMIDALQHATHEASDQGSHFSKTGTE